MFGTNSIIRAQVNFQTVGPGGPDSVTTYMGAVVERERMRRAQRSESGMTLIEVMVSVVILTLITGGITSALLTALNIFDPTSHRVQESNDAQLIAAFLTRDAQAGRRHRPEHGLARHDEQSRCLND